MSCECFSRELSLSDLLSLGNVDYFLWEHVTSPYVPTELHLFRTNPMSFERVMPKF